MSTTCEIKDYGATVYLTKEEANLFMLFKQYQFYWEKIFTPETKNCKVELEFDSQGKMLEVKLPKVYRC